MFSLLKKLLLCLIITVLSNSYAAIKQVTAICAPITITPEKLTTISPLICKFKNSNAASAQSILLKDTINVPDILLDIATNQIIISLDNPIIIDTHLNLPTTPITTTVDATLTVDPTPPIVIVDTQSDTTIHPPIEQIIPPSDTGVTTDTTTTINPTNPSTDTHTTTTTEETNTGNSNTTTETHTTPDHTEIAIGTEINKKDKIKKHVKIHGKFNRHELFISYESFFKNDFIKNLISIYFSAYLPQHPKKTSIHIKTSHSQKNILIFDPNKAGYQEVIVDADTKIKPTKKGIFIGNKTDTKTIILHPENNSNNASQKIKIKNNKVSVTAEEGLSIDHPAGALPATPIPSHQEINVKVPSSSVKASTTPTATKVTPKTTVTVPTPHLPPAKSVVPAPVKQALPAH